MHLLDPQVLAEQIEIRHHEMRENFILNNFVVKNYNEFVEIISTFYEKQYLCTYGINDKSIIPEYISKNKAISILDDSFKSQGGFEYAYNIARTGMDGGLKAILDKIYEIVLRDERENYIGNVFQKVLGLKWESRVELMRQYVAKFKDYIPEGTDIKNMDRLAVNCEAYIRNHCEMMGRMRNLLINVT